MLNYWIFFGAWVNAILVGLHVSMENYGFAAFFFCVFLMAALNVLTVTALDLMGKGKVDA